MPAAQSEALSWTRPPCFKPQAERISKPGSSDAFLFYLIFCITWFQVSFNNRKKLPSKFQHQQLKGWKRLCTRKHSKEEMGRVAGLEVASLKRSCYSRLLHLLGQEIWTSLLICVSFYTKSCNITESIMQVTSTPTSLENLFRVLFPKIQELRVPGHMLVDRILAFTKFFFKKVEIVRW